MLQIYNNTSSSEEIRVNFELFDNKNGELLFQNLISIADEYYLDKDLWKSMIVHLLVNHENSFSLALERKQKISPLLKAVVIEDLKLIFKMYNNELNFIKEPFLSLIRNYESSKHLKNREIHDMLVNLQCSLSNATDELEFYDCLVEHYTKYGVAKYGLNKAFRYFQEEIVPIIHIGNDSLDDLVGLEFQSKLLVDNTEAFLNDKNANNVLLYGDSGTGKSTSVKALLNKYYKDGLRMVEVYKHQFIALPKIIQELQSRNYKFIIFMDDLSFEEFEVEYKYLKAVIEGGLEKKPDNVLIYATSNRRHLIKQTWTQRQGDEVHVNDTRQETLSLSTRFGLSILYGKPDKFQYLEIVDELAKINNIQIQRELLHSKSLTWAIRHGGYSGRVAIQFMQALVIEK